jgi:hypothetical protein
MVQTLGGRLYLTRIKGHKLRLVYNGVAQAANALRFYFYHVAWL